MPNEYQKDADVFKALSDTKRLRILELLRSGEKCACVLLCQLDISQSTLSHHMKILCQSGIVKSRPEGKWTHYSLDEAGSRTAAELLIRLTTPQKDPLGDLQTLLRKKGGTVPMEPGNNSKKTKLYVLTGFLGSGKTTVLLRLLSALKESRVGIIQNEFGKLGIDGEILRNDDIQMVELNRGSIFCSCLRLSFVKALAEMAAQNFDYLFIESSGLGDPSNLAEILEASAQLCGDAYELKGSICLVDAVNFFDQLDDLETVSRQLKHCHMAVLTKTDLVDAARIEALKAKIREINPVCSLSLSANGNLDLSFLCEDLRQYDFAENEDTTNSEEAKPKTLFMNFSDAVEEEKLRRFLLALSGDLYRAKGFCLLSGKGFQQVDLVGRRVDTKPCSEKELSQLTLISKIGPTIIRKIVPLWESEVGVPMQLKN